MTTIFDWIDTIPLWAFIPACLFLAAGVVVLVEAIGEARVHRAHMKRQHRSEYLRPRIGIDKRRGK